MNLFLSIVLFVFATPQGHQTLVSKKFNLTTFTNVPNKYSDCGNGFYFLSEKDAKDGKYIIVTDYDDALIYINNKPITVKVEEKGYLLNKYSVIIIDGRHKNIGDELYLMRSVIILQYGNKIIWKRKLIGRGGC